MVTMQTGVESTAQPQRTVCRNEHPVRRRHAPVADTGPLDGGEIQQRSLEKQCRKHPLRPHQHAGEEERSEEHTSELQSLMRSSSAVFCLKTKKHNTTKQPQTK